MIRGLRVTVMGLGHFGGGAAAARWLAGQGAAVTVTDTADQRTLADSLATLAGVPIAAFHLGGHQEDDFRGADVVVVNPAVRPGNPLVELARQSGSRVTTEIELFLEACPATVVGVTGSNGKSTTAAMTAAILQAEGKRTWLGGNIGGSLLDKLDEMTADDWVVLELSSFQLWNMSAGARMPRVAVVTSCTPNHLDWHGSFEHYAAAKQRILTGQGADSVAVLNTFDPVAASWSGLVRGRQIPLPPLEEEKGDSPHLPERPGGCFAQMGTVPFFRLEELPVLGRHNRVNAACAAAAAHGVGCGNEAIRRGLEGFQGLPQRLEWFAAIDGRRFYNDSTATTPESTIAALESLTGPVWLLAGGRDKGFDYSALAATIARRARGAALFGSVAEMLRGHIASQNPNLPCVALETMRESLDWCWRRSQPGDCIVLSPACSSHDQFRNFRQRGERFVELVTELATERE